MTRADFIHAKISVAEVDALKARIAELETSPRDGIYVASRASIPERSEMWRRLRECGCPINASWIDEAGEGETADFSELWVRITAEISRSEMLILYAEHDDFPLKGALIEVGIALGLGIPVHVVLPGVTLDARNCRPVGSWIKHPLVKQFHSVADAIAAVP